MRSKVIAQIQVISNLRNLSCKCTVFAPFQKLNNLRYNSGNGVDFIRPSQEVFRELFAVANGVHPAYEVCFYHSSIVGNIYAVAVSREHKPRYE